MLKLRLSHTEWPRAFLCLCVFVTLFLVFQLSCTRSIGKGEEPSQPVSASENEVEIRQSWHGDYPVDGLATLPENASLPGVGYIADSKTFTTVWSVFKPTTTVPVIDFDRHLIIFVRNTQYYNRLSIGKILLKNGVAAVLAMETLSARPIEDNVAISMAEVSREGIEGIQARNGVIQVEGKR
jgi:hypothetical protein